jgi:hypothetical protein
VPFFNLFQLYTTQDIFRDYGFVELYPRRYVLGGGTKQSNPLYDYFGNVFSGVYPFEDDDDPYYGYSDLYLEKKPISKIQKLKNKLKDKVDLFKTSFLRSIASPSSNYYGDHHDGSEDGDDDEYYEYDSHPNNNNNNNGHHQRLVAEIDILYDNDNVNNDSNNSSNKTKKRKVFKWIFETPNNLTLRWIQEQLSRLQTIESKVHDGITTLRQQQQHQLLVHQKHNHNIKHEIDTISELYEGYIEVLTLALEHKNDPIGVTEEQFQQELAVII